MEEFEAIVAGIPFTAESGMFASLALKRQLERLTSEDQTELYTAGKAK